MYAGVARTHILSNSLGRLPLDRVRPSHVEGWVVELRRNGLAESTIRSAYRILRTILDTAVRDGALAANPAAAVRRPRVTIKEAPHLTPARVAALLQAARGMRYAPLLALLLYSGLRRGEALAPEVVRRRPRASHPPRPRNAVPGGRSARRHRTQDGEVQAQCAHQRPR
jgi:integrase